MEEQSINNVKEERGPEINNINEYLTKLETTSNDQTEAP